MCDADTVVLVKSALHSNAVLDDKQIHIVHACVLIEIKTDIVIMIQEIVQLRNIAVVLAMASEIDSHLDMNGIGIIGLTAGLIGKIFKESAYIHCTEYLTWFVQLMQQLAEEERKLKEEEKQYKINAERYEEEHYKKPIAKYRTLTKSLKYYEILDDIELVIHVQASDETLCDIYNHIDDLKALGRSEDFVDVEDIQFVNLEQDEESYRSCYSAYLNYEDVMNERINTGWYENRDISGTKYYLGKKYDVSTGKRIFTEKVKVIYTSDFTIDETSENVWVDKEAETEDGQVYIVNFL